MTTESTLLLEAVTEVATLAGKKALSYFGHAPAVETKADGSPVTIADRSAEESARAWISTRFPGDSIRGEELGQSRLHGKRTWIIDPIDGTKSFIHGVPLWGTLIAICDDERVLAGAACFPALNEIIAAAAGAGSWWNGARCSVSSVARISESLVLTTGAQFEFSPARRRPWERLADEAAMARTWGDCYGYLLVATGRAEVMVDGSLADWDAAAVLPIVTEAGGVFTDWNGRETAFGRSAIATNRNVAVEARTLLEVSPLEVS
jgi:histidinol phosphatase-like enzyme (inositol monophosphatase family)